MMVDDLVIHDLPPTPELLAHQHAHPDDQAPGSCITYATNEAGALLEAGGITMEDVTRAVYGQIDVIAVQHLMGAGLLCPVVLVTWPGVRVGAAVQCWPSGAPRTLTIISPAQAETLLSKEYER